MRNYIIGTSGHIDHGKTSIIKALTGIDTDRLKEEKEKGISIDIGFSYLDFNNRRLGIIDIPGHEKFIKNMLAGASGVDICLFIVAADDGIMPQTIEHFDILNLLNIKHGIIVLNKCDRVDEQTIALRKQELREFCQNSFLADSTIVETSIFDEKSIENLKSAINDTILLIEATAPESTVFRMPIDRSFSLKGIGHVITGTTMGANVNVGDKLEILPQKTLVTVKNIQSHNENKPTLSSNNRCALNINFNEKITIKRGNVIATPNMLFSTQIIDVNLECLKNSKYAIKNGQRVRVYHLANESMARVKLMDSNELKQGETGIAQLVLEKPIIAINDDVVVVRNYSPLVTIGGGKIINVKATSAKRFDEQYLKKINKNDNLDDVAKLENIIYDLSSKYLSYSELEPHLISIPNYQDIINNQLINQTVTIGDSIIHKRYIEELEQSLKEYLTTYHQDNPYKLGESIANIRQKFFAGVKNTIVRQMMEMMDIKVTSDAVMLNDFQVQLSQEEQVVRQIVIKNYRKEGYKLAKVDAIKDKINNKSAFDDVFKLLVQDGTLIRMDGDLFILSGMFDELIEYMKTLDKIELSDVRDYANTNRKSVIAILEYCDKNKITKRVGDYRVIVEKES